MSNHLHLVMRSRPDVVAAWSNQEVVTRYWRLHPQRKNDDGSAADPTDAELNIWLNDAVRMKQIRICFMRTASFNQMFSSASVGSAAEPSSFFR